MPDRSDKASSKVMLTIATEYGINLLDTKSQEDTSPELRERLLDFVRKQLSKCHTQKEILGIYAELGLHVPHLRESEPTSDQDEANEVEDGREVDNSQPSKTRKKRKRTRLQALAEMEASDDDVSSTLDDSLGPDLDGRSSSVGDQQHPTLGQLAGSLDVKLGIILNIPATDSDDCEYNTDVDKIPDKDSKRLRKSLAIFKKAEPSLTKVYFLQTHHV